MSNEYIKTRVITLKKKDLFIDIDNLSLSLSRVSGGDDVRRADGISTDTSTDAGARTFKRLTDRRVAELRHLLAEFITPATVTSADDLISTSDYVISLSVTTEMEDSTIDAIVALMHDAVVRGALSDWYTEIGFGPAEALAAQSLEDVAKIRDLIYYRPIPEMQ